MPQSYQETLEKIKPSNPSDDWLIHFCYNNNIFNKAKAI